MAENIERYHNFSSYLNYLGFASVGHDPLEHRRFIQQKYLVYGYFRASDIHNVKTWAKEKHPELPYFMIGHSMSSFALRNTLKDYPINIQGVLLIAKGMSPMLLNFCLPFIK